METTKKISKGKKVLTVILAIAGLLVIGHMYRGIRHLFHGKGIEETIPAGIAVEEYDKYMEGKKDIPSDIEGKSQYDKYVMGLDYKDGSDTDKDGLTDKEEIEVYGTDPLKESTAGDLYTDGFKVKNGLDLFSKCKYREKISFEKNQCKEVLLTADEPSDLHAAVTDYTDAYSLEEFGIDKIYKGYWMYNYSGNVRIDLKKIFKDHGIGYSDIRIWVIQGAFVVGGLSELEECRYGKDENIISLEYEFEKPCQYFIYITGKKKMDIGFSIGDGDDNSSSKRGAGFIYGFPIIEQLFGKGMHVDYSEMDTEEKSKRIAKKAVNYCNDKMGSKIKPSDRKKVTASDKKRMERKSRLFQFFLPIFEYDPVEGESIFNYIFAYVPYEDNGYDVGNSGNSRDNLSSPEEDQNSPQGFNKYRDELPFQNFSSEIGGSGNCVGIAHLTSYLYNKKKFPSKGSYKCNVNGNKKKVSWDLSKHKENATLMDKELYDYKYSSFVDEHSAKSNNYLYKNLTKGEQQFKKMIGCCYAQGNDMIDLNDYIMENGERNEYSLIEKMIAYLDKGKILDVFMYMKGGYGHAVNVYGYDYVESGELVFYVYDSNIPRDQCPGYEMNFDTCILQVKKLENGNGPDTFEYIYLPFKGKVNVTYMATSNWGLMQRNSIVVSDEEWNIFN